MRIAFFFWSLELGGVEHMMVNLSRALVERGHEVTIVLARAPQKNEYTPDPRVKLLRLNADATVGAIRRLAAHMKKEKYDVLYTAMPTTNVAVLIAKILAGSKTKVIISERSNPKMEAAHSKTWRYRLSFVLQPYIYPLANAIIAVCEDLADDLSLYAHIPRRRIQVIYNPAFDEVTVGRSAGPTHPWLDDKTCPVVISAGRLSPQKDFATLIKGFALLRKRRNVRLLILGDGPLRADLQALIEAENLHDCAALPGFIPNIDAYLGKADVFALTSLWEGFGNVLVQALGARLSIVSVNCRNGPREILADGKFGSLVPVGDPAALADALDRTLSAPFDQSAQYSRAQQFTVKASADKYESLFQGLIGATVR